MNRYFYSGDQSLSEGPGRLENEKKLVLGIILASAKIHSKMGRFEFKDDGLGKTIKYALNG